MRLPHRQSSAIAIMPVAVAPVGSLRRLLRIRCRRDLVARPQALRGETVWAVKDPLALRYFHLQDEAWWVLQQLDGQTSAAAIQERYARRFSPRQLTLAHLQSLLGRFHDDGLVVAETPGQGIELLGRSAKVHRRQWLEACTNPLAIRFRGIDPTRMLNWLEPLCRWMFSRWLLAACATFVFAAVVLIATQFDSLLERLPEREVFLGPANLVWLAATLAAIKVLHELGHALTCRRFGGECRELGLMLLVFTPCLYCNVSDAWMLPDKWRRAAIGAAGIVVELTLAAVATFLWWFSQPGLFNALCLNVMFVCSISTLMLNGNPLLRYDGYYVLSDLIETPNLAQESTRVLRDALAKWCLGIDSRGHEELPVGRRAALMAYATLSFAYRWVVLAGILWFIYQALAPHGLEIFAESLAVAIVAGWVVASANSLAKQIHDGLWSEGVQPKRAIIAGIGVLIAATLALAAPLPHRVYSSAMLQPAGASRIYAVVPGTLVSGRTAGEVVGKDDVVATLENSELRLEIARLQGERDRQRLRIETLKRTQGSDTRAAAQLPPAEQLLADLEERLRQRLLDAERLSLTAPIAGTILPARNRSSDAAAGELAQWTGTPLDPENVGCYLPMGTLVCLVGDPQNLEALLVIDQAEIEFIAAGQPVEIALDQQPGNPLRGTISEIAEIDLDQAPPEMLALGEIPTRRDPQGALRPATTFYQARVTLATHTEPLLIGQAGHAKVAAAPLSLGRRLWRAARRTFGMELDAR